MSMFMFLFMSTCSWIFLLKKLPYAPAHALAPVPALMFLCSMLMPPEARIYSHAQPNAHAQARAPAHAYAHVLSLWH